MESTHRFWRAVVIALVIGGVFFALHRDRSPDVGNPQSYSKDGISFRLPGNWSVAKDVRKSSPSHFRYLIVRSPRYARVLIQSYGRRVPVSIERFAEDFHERETRHVKARDRVGDLSPFDEGDASSLPIQSVVSGIVRPGVQQSFSISALGKEVPHRLEAFKVEASDGTVFLVAQAPAKDWSVEEPGIRLVLASFRAQ